MLIYKKENHIKEREHFQIIIIKHLSAMTPCGRIMNKYTVFIMKE